MKGYIYKHIAPNGKAYIGQTTQEPTERWGKNGEKYGSYIGKAIKRYGWQNFKHEILAEIEFEDISLLNNLEEYYILKENTLYPNGYNLKTNGDNYIRTPRHNRNISLGVIKTMGKRIKTFKQRECNKGSKNGMFGKISRNKGKTMSAELVEKNRLGHLGKVASKKSKLKCSKSISTLIWITNGIVNKRIKKNKPIPKGFYKGRTFSDKGLKSITKNISKLGVNNYFYGKSNSGKDNPTYKSVSKEIIDSIVKDFKFIKDGLKHYNISLYVFNKRFEEYYGYKFKDKGAKNE